MNRLVEALHLLARRSDLIRDTHGNVSWLLSGNEMQIKPSGVEYTDISDEDCPFVDLQTGKVLYSTFGRKPSVDTEQHRQIYLAHPDVKAICHTHSPYATAFAIALENIECCSTEQADYFGGSINCWAYADLNSWGKQVADCRVFGEKACLLGSHGVLTFAEDPIAAVNLAVAVENVAMKTWLARNLFRQNELPVLSDGEINKWNERYRTSYGQK